MSTALGVAALPTVALKNANRSTLSLELPTKLPSLANRCYIVGQGQRADVVWSRADFLAICEHMLNGNPLEQFLAAWVDVRTGRACFAKAYRNRADKRASWAWDTITGKAKTKTSIGFYPSNENQMTSWGAMDFDAHNGEHERARTLSLAAFQLLLNDPQLYLVLCTSGGGGFHLFIFTRELHPVRDWIILLKQVCQWIGAQIVDGSCEIFPNERAESQPVGKGIRAPGTFNPKTGDFSLIEAHTTTPLLEWLPRRWSIGVGKVNCHFLRNSGELSLHRSINTYSLSTEGLIQGIIQQHPILHTGTRNGMLMELIGDLAHKFGYQKAREIAERHYKTYDTNIGTPLEEHLKQFDQAWLGEIKKIRERFTTSEKDIYDHLRTEHQREAFRITWAFAGAAAHKGQHEFPIVRDSLADRLSITPPGASEVIRILAEKGATRQTRAYQPPRHPAYYEWICRCCEIPRDNSNDLRGARTEL